MNHSGSILVVDDEEMARDVIEGFLYKEGYQLNFASNGPEALACLEKVSPDVVLLDVMMPGMSGLDVCLRLRQDKRWQHIPVLLITALGSKEDLLRGFEAGANDFLTKPVNEAELRARVRSMLQIKQQYDQLETNLRLREELAQMIVHDLRTPLTVILGHSELLRFKSKNAPEYQVEISQICAQVSRLDSYLNDLLIQAKMEAGQPLVKYSPVNVNDVILQLTETHKIVAESRKVKLKADIPAQSELISLDANLFQRMIDNLVSNALKFAPAESTVTLKLEYLEPSDPMAPSPLSHLRIQVLDHGPGIPEEHRHRIFDKFAIVTLKRSGTAQIGLGLAFCKMVAEAHGGRIYVEANQPVGSIFTVEL
jgi:signal transduction histidine kinase